MKEELVKEALDILTGLQSSRSAISEAAELLRKSMSPEPRFYKGQPVFVSDDGDHWYKALFHSFIAGGGYNVTGSINAFGPVSYKHCKPDYKADSIINWVEHDGGSDMPVMDDVTIATLDSDGLGLETGKAEDFFWEKVRYYAIIPLPEWIS